MSSQVNAWQQAKDIVSKKQILAMQLGLFQPGTLVSFCYLGKARLGVIKSINPKQDAAGEAQINAVVVHLDDSTKTTEVRKEETMCVLLRNVFDLRDECWAKIKEQLKEEDQ